MGVSYTCDISKEPLDADAKHSIEITKFYSKDGQDYLMKSKRFSVSLASCIKTFGDGGFGWKTLQKVDGKYSRDVTNGPL